ncbi:UNVERIFIED_CONTAM: Retrovirus-related Pol polyprotein from transposon gypsy [Sesamum latifolium]|uniref:Retrovirus-related Pol polyprotein from transposon gypsy n=1 Tax=Sesamum latifolium TaxID=2727402 RepID=A0AAW2XP05_9LAMI
MPEGPIPPTTDRPPGRFHSRIRAVHHDGCLLGLKNAGATYQRLVNKMFKDQVGTTMEVYVDDMLVKSRKEEDHLEDLRQAFEVMRTYRMKLNPSKCTFGVRGGKFLGYMVSERGIEANPEKIEAISRLQSPRTLKEVQKLMGHIMTRPDASGRLVKWAVELGEYDVEYQSRTAIKAQVLADFVVEFAGEQVQEEKGGWLLHVDRSSNANNGGVDVLLQGPDGIEIEVAARLSFAATNNKAEYEALILGLQLALEAEARELNVCTDSQLVAMQVEGAYETRERTMTQYLTKVREQMTHFDKCTVQQIPGMRMKGQTHYLSMEQ